MNQNMQNKMSHKHILSFTRPSKNILWCELFLKGPWEYVNWFSLTTSKFQTRGPEPKQIRRGEQVNIHDNVFFCLNCLGVGQKHKIQTNTTIIDAVLCLTGERGHTSSETKIAEHPRSKGPAGVRLLLNTLHLPKFQVRDEKQRVQAEEMSTTSYFPLARKNKPNVQSWRKSLWTVRQNLPLLQGGLK